MFSFCGKECLPFCRRQPNKLKKEDKQCGESMLRFEFRSYLPLSELCFIIFHLIRHDILINGVIY